MCIVVMFKGCDFLSMIVKRSVLGTSELGECKLCQFLRQLGSRRKVVQKIRRVHGVELTDGAYFSAV